LKILIVSATEKENNIILQKATSIRKIGQWLTSAIIGKLEIHFLVSGIGLPTTIYRVTSLLASQHYNLVINCGTAGSFDENLKLGTIVNVANEQFGDLGANDNGTFQTMFDLHYADKNSFPFMEGKLVNTNKINICSAIEALPLVNSITVNSESGESHEIAFRKDFFSTHIENTEGAGVFYVCLLQDIPFYEIRAISHILEPRNTKNWNVHLALVNLGAIMFQTLTELDHINSK
jgi:futalosine hydrolase